MVLALSAALTVIWTNKAFTVSQAEVGGVRYVPAAEIFALAGVAGQHILQVDPQEVAAAIRDAAAREMLFDLDRTIQELQAERGLEDPQSVRLTGIYHNLIRHWAET